MANPSSDQIVEQARQVRRKQVQDCSRRATKEILAKLPTGSHLSEATVADLISREFEELIL
jgi:hypothetical protein